MDAMLSYCNKYDKNHLNASSKLMLTLFITMKIQFTTSNFTIPWNRLVKSCVCHQTHMYWLLNIFMMHQIIPLYYYRLSNMCIDFFGKHGDSRDLLHTKYVRGVLIWTLHVYQYIQCLATKGNIAEMWDFGINQWNKTCTIKSRRFSFIFVKDIVKSLYSIRDLLRNHALIKICYVA